MSIPAALEALESRVRASLAAADLSGVAVYNGPDVSRESTPQAVTIAAAFDDDQDAVSHTREERGAGLRPVDDVNVAGSVYVGSGDVELDDHRATAGRILAAIDDGLRADRQLGGTCALARLASEQWMQGVDENGAGVAVGVIFNLRFLP